MDLDPVELSLEEGEIDIKSINRYKFSPMFRSKRTRSSMKTSKSYITMNEKKCSCPNMVIVDDNSFNLMILQTLVSKLHFSSITVI